MGRERRELRTGGKGLPLPQWKVKHALFKQTHFLIPQGINTKTKSNQGHDFARYLADVLTYSIHSCLAFKLVNPLATSKCHILYLSFPNRLLCLVTQQL